MPLLEEPFRRKRSRRSSAIFGSFFGPSCCVEIDAKSRSTNASIAYSVIATELPKGNPERLDSLEGQAVRACSSKQIVMIINAQQWLSASAVPCHPQHRNNWHSRWLKKKRRSCVRSPKNKMALFSLPCCIESVMQALNEPTNTRRPTKTTVVAAR